MPSLKYLITEKYTSKFVYRLKNIDERFDGFDKIQHFVAVGKCFRNRIKLFLGFFVKGSTVSDYENQFRIHKIHFVAGFS